MNNTYLIKNKKRLSNSVNWINVKLTEKGYHTTADWIEYKKQTVANDTKSGLTKYNSTTVISLIFVYIRQMQVTYYSYENCWIEDSLKRYIENTLSHQIGCDYVPFTI